MTHQPIPRPSDEQLQALGVWLIQHRGTPLPDELGRALVWLCEEELPRRIMTGDLAESDTVTVFDELFLLTHNSAGYDDR